MTFEKYSVEELGDGKVYNENCPDCNCNCDECDCKDCDCPDCGCDDSISEKRKSKPDFLDLDKDGDKKEPMKKAAKEAKEKGSKEEKGGKLTAKQRKLPEGLRKAILARKK